MAVDETQRTASMGEAEKRVSDTQQTVTHVNSTYADRHVGLAIEVLFVVLAFAVMIVPSVCMLWAPTETTAENRELAAMPSPVDEAGMPNVSLLPQLGAYFEDHFAFRNQLVAANARLNSLFGVSSSDEVVFGSDGWLYYSGTLPDYQRTSMLSDRALANIAHNMRMAQDYVEAHGARFVFTIAPNKNTLFGQHMPYYQVAGEGPSNAERLKPHLEAAGVHYVDLFSILSRDDEARYLKTDSHWDNATALRAGNELLSAVGKNYAEVNGDEAIVRTDHVGDIARMLYAVDMPLEANTYFEGVNDWPGLSGSTWRYTTGSSVEDDYIQTERLAMGEGKPEADAAADEAQEGSLLVFRDSFGNALLPFWASSNSHVTFSKLIPYNLPVMNDVHADAVIVERVERHIDYLAEHAPIMPNPLVRSFSLSDYSGATSFDSTVSARANGPYLVLDGVVDESVCGDVSELYFAIEDGAGSVRCYKPFWISCVGADGSISSDYGYQVYLSADRAIEGGSTVHVCVANEQGETFICSIDSDDIER